MCRRHQHAPTASIVMLRSTVACARRQPEPLGVAVPRRPIQQPRGYAAGEVIAHDAHPSTQIGRHPTRQFVLCRYRCSRADRSPKLLGIGPLRSLSLRSNHVSSGSGVCGFASLADFAPKSAIQQVHVARPLACVSLLGDDAHLLGLMRQLDAVAEQVLVAADAAGEDRLRVLACVQGTHCVL